MFTWFSGDEFSFWSEQIPFPNHKINCGKVSNILSKGRRILIIRVNWLTKTAKANAKNKVKIRSIEFLLRDAEIEGIFQSEAVYLCLRF